MKDLLSPGILTWNESLVQCAFPQGIANTIISTPINRHHPGGVDSLLWLPSNNGVCTTRSCYKLLRAYLTASSTLSSDFQALLKKLWSKINVLPDIKHFVWHCESNALPTNARRAATIPTIDPTCALYKLALETTRHLLLDCTFTHQVRAVAGTYSYLSAASSLDDTLHLISSRVMQYALNYWLLVGAYGWCDVNSSLAIVHPMFQLFVYQADALVLCNNPPTHIHIGALPHLQTPGGT